MPPASVPEHLVIVCDWLPPAVNAVGQYMAQRAREEAQAGRMVTLIGLGDGDAPAFEQLKLGRGQLQIVRLTCPAIPKGAIAGRLLWTAQTNARLVAAAHKAQKGDSEIVVTGSPPFLSYLLIAANRLIWRKRLTYRIMDFYPEVVFATGALPWLRWTSSAFAWMRRKADRIEALGDDQAMRLAQSGIDRAKITVNRVGSPVAVRDATRSLERPFGPEAIVLLYSGNLGVAHDPSTFLEAYRRHVAAGGRVRLWVNGSGSRLAEVKAFCAAHALPVAFTPAVPLEDLGALLMTADAHLVLLGEAFWGYVHPSKVYACLETQRPILYFGPPEADAARLVAAEPGGACVMPGNVTAGLAALERLSETVPAVCGRARA